jgi:hypothetical protein
MIAPNGCRVKNLSVDWRYRTDDEVSRDLRLLLGRAARTNLTDWQLGGQL